MPEPRTDERPAALEEFMVGLRQLRERAGGRSFRRMASKSGAVSHATLHLTVTGYRLQPWETVREFVRACDGDEDEWLARWQAADAALTSGGPDPDGADATGPDDDDATGEVEPKRAWWRSRWFLLAPAAVATVVVAVLVVAFTTSDRDRARPAANPTVPVHPGDASRFLGDVTIPDMMLVAPDEQYVKIWEIENSGSVPWRNRFLQRIELPVGPDDCRTPERIPINDTAPQEQVQITVTFRTPATAPVDCKVSWKMIDESGRELLPSYRPIYFEVRVRA